MRERIRRIVGKEFQQTDLRIDPGFEGVNQLFGAKPGFEIDPVLVMRPDLRPDKEDGAGDEREGQEGQENFPDGKPEVSRWSVRWDGVLLFASGFAMSIGPRSWTALGIRDELSDSEESLPGSRNGRVMLQRQRPEPGFPPMGVGGRQQIIDSGLFNDGLKVGKSLLRCFERGKDWIDVGWKDSGGIGGSVNRSFRKGVDGFESMWESEVVDEGAFGDGCLPE